MSKWYQTLVDAFQRNVDNHYPCELVFDGTGVRLLSTAPGNWDLAFREQLTETEAKAIEDETIVGSLSRSLLIVPDKSEFGGLSKQQMEAIESGLRYFINNPSQILDDVDKDTVAYTMKQILEEMLKNG